MTRTCWVTLRGTEWLLIIDKVWDDDPETNAGRELEWHLSGYDAEDHDALKLTGEEEQAIYEQICAVLDRAD